MAMAGLPAGYGELHWHVEAVMETIDAAARGSGETLSAPLDPLEVGWMAAAHNPEAIEALSRVGKELIATRKELGLPDLAVSLDARDFRRLPAFDSMQGNILAVSRKWPLSGKLSRKALAEVARRAAELDRATGAIPSTGLEKPSSVQRLAPVR